MLAKRMSHNMRLVDDTNTWCQAHHYRLSYNSLTQTGPEEQYHSRISIRDFLAQTPSEEKTRSFFQSLHSMNQYDYLTGSNRIPIVSPDQSILDKSSESEQTDNEQGNSEVLNESLESEQKKNGVS